jgi:hypothetical protein
VTLWAVISADIRAQSTLNLSRDLVRLGIATRNLVPNDPALDARAIFQQAIDYAKAHSVSVLTVDPGNYYFLTRLPGLPDRYTNLFQVRDMTIDLAGSTIYFERGYHVGFSLTDCDRVTLTNFQIDYLNPPYTHVLITAVDAPNRRVSYATLPGWPDPVTLNSHTEPPGFEVISYWGAAFRADAFVPATSRMRIVRPISSGTLAFVQDGTPWTQPAALTALHAGDTMVVTARGVGPPGVPRGLHCALFISAYSDPARGPSIWTNCPIRLSSTCASNPVQELGSWDRTPMGFTSRRRAGTTTSAIASSPEHSTMA